MWLIILEHTGMSRPMVSVRGPRVVQTGGGVPICPRAGKRHSLNVHPICVRLKEMVLPQLGHAARLPAKVLGPVTTLPQKMQVVAIRDPAVTGFVLAETGDREAPAGLAPWLGGRAGDASATGAGAALATGALSCVMGTGGLWASAGVSGMGSTSCSGWSWTSGAHPTHICCRAFRCCRHTCRPHFAQVTAQSAQRKAAQTEQDAE